jgi:hypothetical protein
MGNSNAKKSAFLGMPHGTAIARLRKMVLFNLLKKHNENICHTCGNLIERIEDLSLEHKKPWEGISVELFWDLDNIAFSHLFCNRPHRFTSSGPKLRKVGPEGTNWCVRHQKFLPILSFSNNKNNWNGLHHFCKDCQHYNRDRSQLKSNGFKFGEAGV